MVFRGGKSDPKSGTWWRGFSHPTDSWTRVAIQSPNKSFLSTLRQALCLARGCHSQEEETFMHQLPMKYLTNERNAMPYK